MIIKYNINLDQCFHAVTCILTTQAPAVSARPVARAPHRSPSRSARPAGGAGAVRSDSTPSQAPKRARKDRGPNWLPQEVMALVLAKRDMFLEDIDTVDGRDLMTPESTKWQRVSEEVMKCGFSPCPRDGAACKTKWNQIIPEYERIADFLARIGRNGADYWDLTIADRKSEGLPRSFFQELFHSINDWFGTWPNMQPPHTRDLLSHEDGNYQYQAPMLTEDEQVQDSDPITKDPMDIAEQLERIDDTNAYVSPQRRRPSTGTPLPAPPAATTGTPTPRPRFPVPIGMTPVVISSSEASECNGGRKLGNTAVRRKSLSGHTLIAQATRASGDVLAGQMKDMAEASRDIERSKIEMQLKLFAEQMLYQREKDRRLHESSCIANENARLAIEKQGEVVKCLAELSCVLSRGMHLQKDSATGVEPQPAPPFQQPDGMVATKSPPGLQENSDYNKAATTGMIPPDDAPDA